MRPAALLALLLGCAPERGVPNAQPGPASAARRVCADGPTLEGIDVSYFQGRVDWDRVAGDGIAFGIARVSDGTTFLDPEFDANWQGMADAGIVRGAYQFFRPGQSVTAQADLMIDAVADLGPGDLPPVIDVETANGQTLSRVVSDVAAWIDRVEVATGRKPMIYAASGFFNTLPNTAQFADSPLWVANYGVTCPDVPNPWSAWDLWQYTETGAVAGIAGPVDRNRFEGTVDDLLAFAGGTAVPDLPIEVYWARLADGSYQLHALAAAEVWRVECTVDGYPIGGADRDAEHNFPDTYTFTDSRPERLFEVRGYGVDDQWVAYGRGLLDVTSGTAVYIRQMGAGLFEIGLERAPAEVAAIEVEVDGQWLLTDQVEGDTHSERRAVRSTFSTLGERAFAVSTFDADGTYRGTLHRTFSLTP